MNAAGWLFDPSPRAALSIAGDIRKFPVHRIYCVGQNYREHAREMGDSGREPPFFFAKPADAVTQGRMVAYPPQTENLHHEVELVVALAGGGRNIDAAEAGQQVFAYGVGVDLTRRVRSSDLFSDLPVVVVSTLDRPADRLEGLSAGADAYLTKQGMEPEHLVALLRRLTTEVGD